jgi:hypothetical protein
MMRKIAAVRAGDKLVPVQPVAGGEQAAMCFVAPEVFEVAHFAAQGSSRREP